MYSESIHHRAKLVRSEPTLERFDRVSSAPKKAIRRALDRHRSFTPAAAVASLPALQSHARISAVEPRAAPTRNRASSKSWDEGAMDRSASSSSDEEVEDLARVLGGGRTMAAAETTVPAQLLFREFSTKRGSRTASGRRLSAPPGQLATFGGTSTTEIVLLTRHDESPPRSASANANGAKKSAEEEERDVHLHTALAGVEDMSFSVPKVGARKPGRKGLTKASLGEVSTTANRIVCVSDASAG